MLTTVKTLADVRQVLRGYASPHPPEAEDYYDRRLAERAAAKAKEEKEPIAQEAREAERATARHAVAGPNKPRGPKIRALRTSVERGSTMRCWIFRPRANPHGRAPRRSVKCGPNSRRGWRRSKSTSRHRGPVVSQRVYAGSVLAWASALTVRRREVPE
jgi:hypothetical protein